MKFVVVILFLLINHQLFSQTGAINIKDNGNIIMSGNVNLIIHQTSNQGIVKSGNLQGGIICDNEQSRVIWGVSTLSGNYVIPFKISNTSIPLIMNITLAGVGAGQILTSTYRTNVANFLYPNGYGYFNPVTNMNYNGVDNSNNAVDRFWIINYDGYVIKPISQFTMTYDPVNELNGIIEVDLKAQYWDGAKWVLPPDGIADPPNDNVNSIQSISLNTPWVLINKLVPLYLTLSYYYGNCNEDGTVRLVWETLQEMGVQSFEIQRSYDGINFEIIGVVPAAGSTTMPEGYDYVDPTIYYGTRYYKLIELDFNGYTEEIGTVNVNCGTPSNISIHPNPLQYGEELIITGIEEQDKIEVFDVIGQKIQIECLIPGIYIVVINNIFITKLVVN